MKARIKFSKTGSMKFLGHLDVMRYFQKAFRRCELDITYSQGFNPHPMMSFASPLGVGLTSEGEYLDLELNTLKGQSPDQWTYSINKEMNGEIQIISFTVIKDSAKPSMAVLAAADYEISVKEGYTLGEHLNERLEEFLNQKAILIIKKTKKSETEIDLKDYIYDILPNRYTENILSIRLAAGSIMNIKPELLLEAFCQYSKLEYQPFAFQVHRLEMYTDLNAVKGIIHSNKERGLRNLIPLSELTQ